MNAVIKEEILKEMGVHLIDCALQAGADEAATSILSSSESLARFSRNSIIENGERYLNSFELAVAIGKKEAVINIDNLNPDDFKKYAEKAVSLAKLFPENPEHTHPVDSTSVDWVDCTDKATIEKTHLEKAEVIGKICRKAKSKDLLAFGTLSTGFSSSAVVNSAGVKNSNSRTEAEFTLTIRTEDGSGSCRETRKSHRFDEIGFEELTDKTMSWAVKSRNGIEIEPGDYTVLLTPTAAVNFIPIALWCFDERMVNEKRSALVQHFNEEKPLGKQLFSPSLSIYSRVNHPSIPKRAYGHMVSMEGMAGQGTAMHLFSEGLPVSEYPIIENGVLRKLFSSLYYARKNNCELSAFPNIIQFSDKDQTIDQMILSTERGLLINSFWYIRFVDSNHLLLTGLTRDGVFLVENGQISQPVKNLRFNESPLVALCNLQDYGRAELRDMWRSTMLIPPLKIGNFTFSAHTDAI